MAGCSVLKNESALDRADTINVWMENYSLIDTSNFVKDSSVVDDDCDNVKGSSVVAVGCDNVNDSSVVVVVDSDDVSDNVVPVDESVDKDCYVELRTLFYQVLSISVNKAIAEGRKRPMPALLGDGKSVDLFELFLAVIKRGGFEMVNGFWTFVVKEIGLDPGVAPSVKLIYVKYLLDLETWLGRRSSDGGLENKVLGSLGNFGLLASDLEVELRSLLSRGFSEEMIKGDGLALSKQAQSHKYIGNDVGKSGTKFSGTSNIRGLYNAGQNRYIDDDNKFGNIKHSKNKINGLLDSVIDTTTKEFKSSKRKRESISAMLKWLMNIAKCPDEPSIGVIPPASKWKEHDASELWSQVIRARNMLLQRQPANSKTKECPFQSGPSDYEEISHLSDLSAKKLRYSERLSVLAKPHVCSFSNSGSAFQSISARSPTASLENGPNQALMADDTFSPSEDEQFRMSVSVGPRFQAEVPEWTGMIEESDPKWLGTRQWPTDYVAKCSLVKLDAIGKGAPDICDCRLRGSVGCVRFHTAERRMKLKLELGQMFFHWRFNHMGEEVSLRWTAEEEKRFSDMVRLNKPSQAKCFWDYARYYLPKKTREDLVSYYFNVFVVRRRGYQNRATPNSIDSDDDETEFGGYSERYGHEAVEVHSSNTLICSENQQSTDFR